MKAVATVAAIVVFAWATLSFQPAPYAQTQQQAPEQEAASEVAGPVADEETADDRIANYTLALTITTIFLVGSTVLLWWETRGASRDGREGKRAFVFAPGLTPVYEPSLVIPGEHNWRFVLHWQNTGDTATKRMRIYAECRISNAQLAPNFDFTQEAVPSSKAFLGPKATNFHTPVPWQNTVAITPRDIADVQMGHKFLYVWGSTKYFDVFRKTPERITRVAWQIFPIGSPFTFDPAKNPAGVTFTWVQLASGNCTDDECNDQ